MNEAPTQPLTNEPPAGAATTPENRKRRAGWGRRVRQVVLAAMIGYGAWCGGMYLWQDQLLFPSYMAPKADGAVPRSVDVMTITTEAGGQVPAWFLAAPGVSAEHPGPAVLYFHGNGEIVDLQERVNALWWDLGVSLLIMEYRGYGRAGNAGKPSEAALVADGVKFFDQLIQRPEVDSKRVIIHGYSIGGGVAAQVAARRKPAVLVLESTFTSIADFAPRYGLPRWLAKNPFHTDEVLPGLNVPIFIAHGRPDTIVPVEHGRRLHALAPTSTYVELDCGHMNLPGYHAGDPYRDQLRQFLVQSGVLPMGTSTRVAQ